MTASLIDLVHYYHFLISSIMTLINMEAKFVRHYKRYNISVLITAKYIRPDALLSHSNQQNNDVDNHGGIVVIVM